MRNKTFEEMKPSDYLRDIYLEQVQKGFPGITEERREALRRIVMGEDGGNENQTPTGTGLVLAFRSRPASSL
jgi:hypothetical protein